MKKPIVAGSVKAGAKRTALGGVVSNSQKEEVQDGKAGGTSTDLALRALGIVAPTDIPVKGIKAEVRQPLAARNAQAPAVTRPIAPVPARAKSIAVYANPELATMEEDEEIVSEMDVDPKQRIETEFHYEDEGSVGELSGEEEEEEEDDEDWTKMPEEEVRRAEQELTMIKSVFQDEVDMFDTTMVAEYADDIFMHMEALEETTMPNPRYMDFQTEIEW